MLVSLRQHINPGNWMVVTPIWKNVVLDTYDMLCTMPPSMSATGNQHLLNILPRSEQKASTIMLPYHML